MANIDGKADNPNISTVDKDKKAHNSGTGINVDKKREADNPSTRTKTVNANRANNSDINTNRKMDKQAAVSNKARNLSSLYKKFSLF